MTRKILLLESELMERICGKEDAHSILEELFMEEYEENYVLLERLFYFIGTAIRHKYKDCGYKKCKDEMFEYINGIVNNYKKVSYENLNSRYLSLYLIYMNSCKYDVSMCHNEALQILNFLLDVKIMENDKKENKIKVDLLQEKIEILLSQSELNVDDLIATNQKLKELLNK